MRSLNLLLVQPKYRFFEVLRMQTHALIDDGIEKDATAGEFEVWAHAMRLLCFVAFTILSERKGLLASLLAPQNFVAICRARSQASII